MEKVDEVTTNREGSQGDLSKDTPRIEKIERKGSTKWISLHSIDYVDQGGVSRKWDSAFRTTKGSGTTYTDAVIIIPLLKKSGSKSVETVVLTQYRPPVKEYAVEFPAGLLTKGESPEEAALRKLKSETGFVGGKCSQIPGNKISNELCMSPGLVNETIHCITVEVDLDNPKNQGTPKRIVEDGKLIEITRIELREGLKKVLEEGKGIPFIGLYMFAMGLDMGMSL